MSELGFPEAAEHFLITSGYTYTQRSSIVFSTFFVQSSVDKQ